MSKPMLAAFHPFVKQLALPWHHYQLTNLKLLGSAFLQRRSMPLRRLARTLAGPGKALQAADKRLRRFLGNRRLNEAAQDAAVACLLQFILARLRPVPFVPVMFDWLFVDGHALLGLQIPYRGRSLPLFFCVHAVSVEEDEQGRTQAEQKALQRLIACWPTDAPPFVLLCDRGFAKGPLVAWLLQQKVRFIIRVPKEHHLYDRTGSLLNEELGQGASGWRRPPLGKARLFLQVRYTQERRLPVHFVITAKADPKTGSRSEWWLITNLAEEHLAHVPRLYGQRMSPEELHRDCKRGYAVAGFGLCHLGRMRRDRLQRYMLIMALVACFLVLVAETERETRAWLCKKHWGIGLLTMGLDLLHDAGAAAKQLAKRACASVTLEPLWLPGVHS